MTYKEPLLDPRWQKKRLRILERDEWKCVLCGDEKTTLHIHHDIYKNNAWEVDDEFLRTLCSHCHLLEEHYKIYPTDSKIEIQKVSKRKSDLEFFTVLYVYRLRDDGYRFIDIFTVNDSDPSYLRLGIVFCEQDLDSFIDFIEETKINNG